MFFILGWQNIWRNTHPTKKNVFNENFIVLRGKRDSAKFYPTSHPLGLRSMWGALKFRIGTSIFYRKFRFSIKRHVSFMGKFPFYSRRMTLRSWKMKLLIISKNCKMFMGNKHPDGKKRGDHMFLRAIDASQLQISSNWRSKSKVLANDAYSAQNSTFSAKKEYIILIKIHSHFKVMLLKDVQPYDSDVLHLSISTKTYWWHELLSNGGYLFVHLIYRVRHIKCYTVIALKLLIIFKNVSDISFSVQEGRHTGPPYFFIGGGSEVTSSSTPLF